MLKTKFLELLERTIGKKFAANIAKLLSGAVLGMAIGFLVTPILARFYTPDEFGLYGIITALVGTFAGISAFRYGMAIVLPKDDSDAANLVALSLLGVTFTGIWTCIVFIGGGDLIALAYEKPELSKWLWTVPLLIVLTGVYESLRFWSTRKQRFGAMSTILVSAAIGSAASKVIAGSQKYNHSGLIVGQIIGQAVGTILMIGLVFKTSGRNILDALSFGRIKAMGKKYIDFPKYNVPVTLLNALAKNLPVFGLGFYFPNAIVGLYSMAFLLLKAPVFLVSNALRQVFYQRASEIFHEKGDLYSETMKLTKITFAVAILPASIFAFFATPLLETFLGSNWTEAGIYASVLTPYLMMMFVSTPAASLFPILNLQRWNLIWQVFSFGGTLLAITIGGITKKPVFTVAIFSAVGTILQVVLILGMAYVTKRPHLWKDSYEEKPKDKSD